MIVPYYPEDSSDDYQTYYLSQVGHGFNVFRGESVQTGHGIGSFLGGLARKAMPMLKNFAGKALKTGVSIAKDAIDGKDVGQSAIRHARKAGSELVGNLADHLHDAGDGNGSTDDDIPPPPKRRRKSYKRGRQSSDGAILNKVRIQR